MPDPISYLKASIAAVVASAMIVLAFRLILRKTVQSIATVVCVLAVGAGVVTGYGVLQFSYTWPPANALNRFLMIVLPATLVVELLAAISGRGEAVSSRILANSATKRTGSLWTLGFRLALYACIGRILLHDSVYLGEVGRGNPEAWTFAKTLALFGGSFAGLIAGWSLLCRLSERSAAGSITVSLALVIQCTGLATMMAGYIKGGAAAIPLAAALAGTTLASPLLGKCPVGSDKAYLRGTIGIGVIGLLSLLLIGHYFGQLTGLRAIVLFLTPLLGWISELPGLRSRSAWQKSGVRLTAVTMVLSAVLFFTKRDFDIKMAPLLVGVGRPVAELQLSSGTDPDLRRRVGQAAAKPRRPTIFLHTRWAGVRVARWSHPAKLCPRATRVRQTT
jgi:hypothetical protein